MYNSKYLKKLTSAEIKEQYPTAKIGESTIIYNGATICDNVRIGENCIIYDYALIGENCIIGNNVVIDSHAVLDDAVFIDNNCDIGSYTVIGSRTKLGKNVNIMMASEIKFSCLLCDNVKIDSFCCIKEYSTIMDSVNLAPYTIIGEFSNLKKGDEGIVLISKNQKINSQCYFDWKINKAIIKIDAYFKTIDEWETLYFEKPENLPFDIRYDNNQKLSYLLCRQYAIEMNWYQRKLNHSVNME